MIEPEDEGGALDKSAELLLSPTVALIVSSHPGHVRE